MKPENLQSPFKWEDRHVIIQDRVFYVPDFHQHFDTFSFPEWSSDQVFNNSHPVYVEYCSGNGGWVVSKATEMPHINWVAVERRFMRVRKIWSKIKNSLLSNLFIVCGEALNVTEKYFPKASVDKIFINFPDPWPKNRHAKNRLIQRPFLDELWQILKEDGTVTLVTDDKAYSDIMINEFQKHPGFESSDPPPFYRNELSNYGTSFFEELWRGKGKEIRYHSFSKVPK